MSFADSDARELLQRAADGESQAIQQLLEKYRPRLRRMIEVRMNPLLSARFDPSDIVQEALAEAAQKLPEYGRKRNCPFYPWLRQIAWERLVELHRRQVIAQRRSILREEPVSLPLSDSSQLLLARHFIAADTSPSNHLLKQELRQRVRDALERLSPADREVLVLRYLEELSIQEAADILHLSQAATQSRFRRALERMHALLTEGS